MSFCGIGEVVSFMVDGFVDGLLILDWMGVWELYFEQMSLDAELAVFTGDFGGVLFDGMQLEAELLVFNGDFGGVFKGDFGMLEAELLVFNGDFGGVWVFNGDFG